MDHPRTTSSASRALKAEATATQSRRHSKEKWAAQSPTDCSQKEQDAVGGELRICCWDRIHRHTLISPLVSWSSVR